jgi:hypothetical protein
MKLKNFKISAKLISGYGFINFLIIVIIVFIISPTKNSANCKTPPPRRRCKWNPWRVQAVDATKLYRIIAWMEIKQDLKPP